MLPLISIAAIKSLLPLFPFGVRIMDVAVVFCLLIFFTFWDLLRFIIIICLVLQLKRLGLSWTFL